ncbi:MAG: hypothetical protein QOH44_2308 [Actinomycetota bacterium]|nr:hypothetical protein [Actinomycetota bacterium]
METGNRTTTRTTTRTAPQRDPRQVRVPSATLRLPNLHLRLTPTLGRPTSVR